MANLTAEKLFLSGLIRHTDKYFEYAQYLDDDDFHNTKTRLVHDVLRSLIVDKESVNISKSKIVSEARALGHQNFLSATDNGEWLDELLSESISEKELDHQFLEVKRQSLIEGYIGGCHAIHDYLKSNSDNPSKIISTVEDMIVSKVHLLDKGENAIIPLNRDIWEFIDGLAEDPGHIGVDLGYKLWQDRIGNVRNGGVTFLAGTTGSGKSQFGLRAALSAARMGLPVLYLDSELNEQDQKTRMVGMLSKVPYQYIETGFWRMSEKQLIKYGVTDEDVIKDIVNDYKSRLTNERLRKVTKELPIDYVSVSGLDMEEILPHIRRWVLTKVKPDKNSVIPQCLVIYDYIKLASLNELKRGNAAEWQINGVNMSHLHSMMQNYNIPCLALGQTNNEMTDGLKCVAGGKRISENCTSVSILRAKSPEERSFDPDGSHLIKVFKARYGSGTHNSHINFNADLRFGEFEELQVSTVDFFGEKQKRFEEMKNKRKKNKDDDDF